MHTVRGLQPINSWHKKYFECFQELVYMYVCMYVDVYIKYIYTLQCIFVFDQI